MQAEPIENGNAKSGTPHLTSPLLLVLAAALLWSTGGLFIKWSSLSDVQLTFGRALLAVLTVAYFTRKEGFRINGITAVSSILYAALLFLFVRATKLTTAANAIFLQYTAPIYILALEPLVFKEKFRLGDMLAVAVCLGGMTLFFVGKLDPNALAGNLTALGSGVCMALYFLLLRHPSSQKVNRASSVIYGNLLLVVIFAPMVLQNPPQVITVLDVVSVSWLGIVQIGIAYILFTLGMARGVRSLDAGIVGYIEPVLNPVWVFLFIGERPSMWALVGGAIIITAVLMHTIWGARRARLRV